ncbi:protein phosphatase 2C domain-containing protein [Synechococcus sp. 8F6]|uniref:protein phosphatase 2C domain-containing protein n=1 Tax=Synechococcus sp. 8F6 TaxID=2025606 RepID=UPI001303C161|nr:protein phosphatase 2C domain-containing protein [Synechococcus sp. 8F6]
MNSLPPAAPPRVVGARKRGEGHAARQEPCCDALWLPPSNPRLGGFVICDGAGGTPAVARSAQLSARAGWQALLLLRRQLARPARRAHHHSQQHLQHCFVQAFWHGRRPGPIADHTLLACLWDRQRLLIAQVGDTTLLLRQQGRWQLPLPLARGEYANETTFLRPTTPASAVGLWWAPAHQIEAVIGFSDGLEAAFLQEQQPNGPLADLVLQAHRQHLGWRGYPAWLADSLADPALAALSDDDRTLVVAAR